MSFPISPSNGQSATINGIVYTFSNVSNAWTRVASFVTNTSSLNVTGNITSGNLTMNGSVITSGNITVNGNLSVNGSPIYGVYASYARYTRTTAQASAVANTVVVCNTLDTLAGTDITANTTSGQFTLAAGKTYRLKGLIPGWTGSAVGLQWCWYNETTGSWIGSSGENYPPSNNAAFAGAGGAAEAMVTPNVATVVSFRILSAGGTAGLGGNSDFSTTASYPWVDIEVIGGQAGITSFSNINANNITLTANTTTSNLTVGLSSGFMQLPNLLAQFSSNANSYAQINAQNISNGNQSSTEIVATANNGTDSTFFVDMGIAGNTYNTANPNNSLGTTIYPNDSYVYAQGANANVSGGNLAVGASTAGKTVKIFAGGINANSIVATFASNGVTVAGNLTVTGNLFSNGYGYFPGAFDETTTQAGVFVGNTGVANAVSGWSPRIAFFNGNTSQNWEQDNYGGTLRWFTPGTTRMQVESTNNQLTVFGNVSSTGLIIANTGSISNDSQLVLLGNVYKGGSGYHDFLRVTSTYSGVTNPNKYFRLNQTGGLEILNSAYSSTLLSMTDKGDLTISGNLSIGTSRPAFRVVGNGGSISATTTVSGGYLQVDYNQGGYLNTSTGIFTAPLAGLYQVDIVARAAGNNLPAAQVIVRKTVSGSTATAIMLEWAANTTVNHIGGSSIVKLAVGDTLKFDVTTGTISFDGNDNWSVAYIG